MALLSCGTDPPEAGESSTDVVAPIDTGVDVGSGVDSGSVSDSGCKSPAACPAGKGPCQEATCIAGTCGVQNVPGPCDDGDPCTVKDRCQGGSCEPTSFVCACQATADCASLEDGNACNGTLFCDKAKAPYVCRVKPSTVVTCSSAKDTACSANTCDPQTGKCVAQPTPNGTPCVDSDPCTVDSSCQAGECKGGSASWCQCKTTADCAQFGDNDACNGVLFCDKATFPPTCRINPTSIVTCATNKDGPCSVNTCDPKTGTCAQQAKKDGTLCDDGGSCANEGTCKAGACLVDSKVCMCTTNSDCADKDDGDFCNGTLFCDKKGAYGQKNTCTVNPATLVKCPTVGDTSCQHNVCNPALGTCGMTPRNEGKACDDNDSCTTGDHCKSGQCVAGKDLCACDKDSDCKDDGNACNGLPFCNLAKKQCETNPTAIVVCPPGLDTACEKNTCNPASGGCQRVAAGRVKYLKYVDGKVHGEVMAPTEATKTGITCDDGNPCTSGEQCVGKTCKTGGTVVCTCTKDGDCTKQDDGDLCNGIFFCDLATHTCKPKPNSHIVCKTVDDTDCRKQRCEPKLGLCLFKPEPLGKPCEDGAVCSQADYCNAQGQCLAGKTKVCDDGNACTTDTCDPTVKWSGKGPGSGKVDPKAGCLFLPKKGHCDDGNACTVDICNAKTGKCEFKTIADGKACNGDNNGCTVNDVCHKGACKTGPKPSCPPAKQVCRVNVCVSKAANDFTCKPTVAPEDHPCDDSGGCKLGGGCKAGKCVPGVTDKIWAKTIAPKAGAHLRLQAAIADGTDWLVGGRVWDEKPDQHGWYIARIGGNGDVKASWELPVKDRGVGGWIGRLVRASGVVWAVGSFNQGSGYRVRVTRLKGVQPAVTYNLPLLAATVNYGNGAAAFPDGSLAVVGESRSKAVDGLFKRIAPNGDVVGHAVVQAQGFDATQFNSATIDASNRVWAAGNAWKGPNYHTMVPVVVRLGKTGKVELSSSSFGKAGYWRRIVRHAGGLLLVGRSGYSTALAGRIARLSADGTTLWHRANSGPYDYFDVVPSGSGLVVVGSSKSSQTGDDAMFRGVDLLGNGHWQRDVFGLGSDVILAALPVEGGGVFAAGARSVVVNTKSRFRGWISRADRWGHRSCSSAGKCHGKNAALCDDDKDCTADDCNPITGQCQHKSVDGFACEGNGCAQVRSCKAGMCQPVGKTRLWLNSPHVQLPYKAPLPLRRVTGLVPAKNGGVFVSGNVLLTGSKGGWRGFAIRYDRHGAMTWYRPHGARVVAGVRASSDAQLLALNTGSWMLIRDGPASFSQVDILSQNCRAIKVGKGEACTHATFGFAARPDGRAIAVIREVRKVSPVLTGTLIWTGTTSKRTSLRGYPSSPGTDEQPSAITATGINDATIVGRRLVGSHQTGLAWGVDGQGKLTYKRALGDKGSALESAVQHPAGGTLVLGHLGAKAGLRPAWLAHLDPLGRTRFSRKLDTASSQGGHAIAIRPDGTIAAALPDFKGGKLRSVLVGLSAAGAVSWTQELAQTWYPAVHMLRGDNDGWWVGLERSDNRSAIARTDPWGRRRCTDAGVCFDGKLKACDDNDACTADLCDTKKGCTTAKSSCDDANPCTKDACDGKKGCLHSDATGVCDDGDVCTGVSTCMGGVCTGGKAKTCDDGEQCTIDLCDPAAGCLHANHLDGTSCKTTSVCAPVGKCGTGKCVVQPTGRLYRRNLGVYYSPAGYWHVTPEGSGAVVSEDRRAGSGDFAGRVIGLNDLGTGLFSTPLEKNTEQLAGPPDANGTRLIAANNLEIRQRDKAGVVKKLFSADQKGECGNFNYSRPYPWHLARMSDTTIAVFVLKSVPFSSGGTNQLLIYGRYHSNGLRIFFRCGKTHLGSANRTFTTVAGPVANDFAYAGSEVTQDGKQHVAYVTRLDNFGKPVFTATIKAPGVRFVTHNWLADDSHVAIGDRLNSAKKTVPWLAWFDAKGKFTGDVMLASHPGGVAGATRVSSGHFAIARNVVDGFHRYARLDLLSAKGKPLWSHKLVSGPFLAVDGGGLTWSGRGFYLRARDTDPSKPQSFFAHISPWGAFTCPQAGKCFDLDGKLWAACVKKCGTKTPDCDPKLGCTCK